MSLAVKIPLLCPNLEAFASNIFQFIGVACLILNDLEINSHLFWLFNRCVFSLALSAPPPFSSPTVPSLYTIHIVSTRRIPRLVVFVLQRWNYLKTLLAKRTGRFSYSSHQYNRHPTHYTVKSIDFSMNNDHFNYTLYKWFGPVYLIASCRYSSFLYCFLGYWSVCCQFWLTC